jgi:hypothetical protein
MLRQVISSSFPVSSFFFYISLFYLLLRRSTVFLILYPYGYPWPRKLPCAETISSLVFWQPLFVTTLFKIRAWRTSIRRYFPSFAVGLDGPFLKARYDEHRFASIFLSLLQACWAILLFRALASDGFPSHPSRSAHWIAFIILSRRRF